LNSGGFWTDVLWVWWLGITVKKWKTRTRQAQGSMLVWVISFKGLRLATTSGLKPIDLHLACDLAVLSFHDAVIEPKI
jgi:hypothetical protein